MRLLGEENEDVAIIIDSGADVALFPLSMADDWEGELRYKMHKEIVFPWEARKVLKFPFDG